MRDAARQVIDCAARVYTAPDIESLRKVCMALQRDGFGSSVCFWNNDGDTVEAVTRSSLCLLEVLRCLDAQSYLSLKLPALQFDSWSVNTIVKAAAQMPRLVHFDSHGPEDADRMFMTIESALKHNPNLGCTLPGRGLGSSEDARLACRWRLRVRVVKGQWSDPRDPAMDIRAGFLRVIDELGGRASSVAVASHDLPLARKAILRLLDAGTPCELELLYGIPCRAAIRMGRDLDVPIRFYVPQGKAWLPYLMSHARKNPRVLGWLIRDIIRGYFRSEHVRAV